MNDFTRVDQSDRKADRKADHEVGQTAFPVARAGFGFIYAAAFTTAVFALLELTVPALLGLTVTLGICFFFRDPDRVVPAGNGLVVSPADGKVISTDRVSGSPVSEAPCIRISVFMTVFNVHVNRIPHEGKIRRIKYSPGNFFSANLDKASTRNEHNAVLLETENGISIGFVQVAGLIARRIICDIQEEEYVKRGQRFGMICFGSRLDVYIPPDSRIRVAVGDKVKAGTSVLGNLA
jgi:phosphatidylserine decarboxylase